MKVRELESCTAWVQNPETKLRLGLYTKMLSIPVALSPPHFYQV